MLYNLNKVWKKKTHLELQKSTVTFAAKKCSCVKVFSLLASWLRDAKYKGQADVSTCWRSHQFQFSHALITWSCIGRAGNNCAIVSWSGYIWIWSWARDQESTNHNALFAEWKSRSITTAVVSNQLCEVLYKPRIEKVTSPNGGQKLLSWS